MLFLYIDIQEYIRPIKSNSYSNLRFKIQILIATYETGLHLRFTNDLNSNDWHLKILNIYTLSSFYIHL